MSGRDDGRWGGGAPEERWVAWGVLGQFPGHGRREGARKAPDQPTQVSEVICGRQHQDTGLGEASGRDRDAVVQGRWKDNMMVFG